MIWDILYQPSSPRHSTFHTFKLLKSMTSVLLISRSEKERYVNIRCLAMLETLRFPVENK